MQEFVRGPLPGGHIRRWSPLTVGAIVSVFIAPLLMGAATVIAVENRQMPWRTAVAVFATAWSLVAATIVVVAAIRLHASEQLYRTLVDTASDGVFLTDAQGRFTFVNHRFAEMLARDPADLLGLPGLEFMAVPEPTDRESTLRSRRSGSFRAQREFRFTLPNGEERFVIATTTSLTGPTRRFNGVVGTITDITPRVTAENERRKLYEENEAAHRTLQRAHEALRTRVSGNDGSTLEDLAERLSTANHELETFTYSVSHDLRAPLRSIIGFAEELLAQKNSLDERGRHYLDRISAAATRMTALIDDLLTLSRTSRETLHRRNIDVTACAREVASEHLARHPHRVIEVDVEEGLAARADGRLIRIVFENLIGNAVKFTSKRESAHIRVHRVVRDGVPFIAVTDNGTGFDPAYASRLFMPFHRLHRATEFEGNGIGLAIVYRIVHRHGGITWAEAVPGEGATFAFSLGAGA
jgi:PAS domain S-box-containing protein